MTEQIVVPVGDGILLFWKEYWTEGIPHELEWPPGTDVEWKEQNQENNDTEADTLWYNWT